jgi:hypothetical protein
MEFLLTYGWAILVVVIAISTLSYFGVLSPTGLAMQPNQCTIDVGLTCVDHRIEFVPGESGDPDSNNLHMVVVNNRGDSLHITNIKLLDEYGKQGGYDITAPNGQEVTFDLIDITVGNPAMPSGARYNKEFEIELTNTVSGLPHTYRGRITGKVD